MTQVLGLGETDTKAPENVINQSLESPSLHRTLTTVGIDLRQEEKIRYQLVMKQYAKCRG